MKFLDVILENDLVITKDFLSEFDLTLDDNVDYSINCFDGDKIIGTVSCSKNIIKCLAVNPEYQGENIAGQLVTKMLYYISNQNFNSVFVFTSPENKFIFNSLNFTEIIQTSHTIFMEKNSSITETLNSLKKKYSLSGEYASIIVNCNPMTNGHVYLIEQCAKSNEQVIVFVVEEDLSVFKFADRFQVVKDVCAKFKNVTVVPSTQYIISRATFPTYFLKDDVDFDDESMELDLKIFKKYFMPILGIKSRYIGTEPYNVLTNNYNKSMKKYLDNVIEIERIEYNNVAISATYIRKLISENNLEKIEKLVPVETYKMIKDKYL